MSLPDKVSASENLTGNYVQDNNYDALGYLNTEKVMFFEGGINRSLLEAIDNYKESRILLPSCVTLGTHQHLKRGG